MDNTHRLKRTKNFIQLAQDSQLNVSDFIYPMFIAESSQKNEALPDLPYYSIDTALHTCEKICKLGIPGIMIFDIVDKKDDKGSGMEAMQPEEKGTEPTRRVERRLPERRRESVRKTPFKYKHPKLGFTVTMPGDCQKGAETDYHVKFGCGRPTIQLSHPSMEKGTTAKNYVQKIEAKLKDKLSEKQQIEGGVMWTAKHKYDDKLFKVYSLAFVKDKLGDHTGAVKDMNLFLKKLGAADHNYDEVVKRAMADRDKYASRIPVIPRTSGMGPGSIK